MRFAEGFAGTIMLAVAVSCISSGIAARQREAAAKNPVEGNPQAIADGKGTFRINCSICHGLNSEGGVRGPSLRRGHFIHGGSDAALFSTILRGVPGTMMPANDLSDDETWEVIAYLRSMQLKATAKVIGNPEAGEKYFFGEGFCYTCHMIRGRGGRLGPDLSRVGVARSPQYLVEAIREPDMEISEGLVEPGRDFPMRYDTVTLTLPNGEKITGIAKNEDSFSIQLMDDHEQLRFFAKRDLKNIAHERKSLMPAYPTTDLSEAKLQDLLAYLESLRGE